MNIKKYITLLNKKKINNLSPFKKNYLYINNNFTNIEVEHVNTIKNFNNYVLNLFTFNIYKCYALKNIFYWDLRMENMDVDLIVFNNKMEITNIISTKDKKILINSLFTPINVIVLNKNSCKYFNISVGSKINFGMFFDLK